MNGKAKAAIFHDVESGRIKADKSDLRDRGKDQASKEKPLYRKE